MPPKKLFDLDSLDTGTVLADREAIYQVLPHRFEFQQLDGILLCDRETRTAVAYRDVREDEFWVRGHIPGRPIFPGVLMIETAAHVVSYYVHEAEKIDGFLGFGGVTNVKFRGAVVPGQRIITVGKILELRRRRCVGATQAYVDGALVYEGEITGMWV